MEDSCFAGRRLWKTGGLIALLSVRQRADRITRSALRRTLAMMAGGDISEKSHYRPQHLYFAVFQTLFFFSTPHMQGIRICGVSEFTRRRCLVLMVHVWYTESAAERFVCSCISLPDGCAPLYVHLRLHTVHVCGRLKSLYIITRNPRERVDRAPAHQCPPEVPHTVSQRCPPIVIYDNHRDQVAAHNLNHAGGGSEKPERSRWTADFGLPASFILQQQFVLFLPPPPIQKSNLEHMAGG